MAKGKVIISCAVTGAIHTPSMSPHLPITASEIAEAAIGAAEAGAAIIHLHARNPEDGRPDQNPDLFEPFLKVIKQRSDAVINLTTGGHPSMTLAERLRPATTFQPEVASLNMGTMGFGLFPMLDRYPDWKYDWEPATLAASRDLVFKNTYKDIEDLLALLTPMGTLKYFLDRGLVKAPLFIQTCFGILGGIGSHPDDIMHMKRTADRLFGDQYEWSVLGAGAKQMSIIAMAASMGGNVRVGLEDSLWAGPGKLAETNAQQVKMAREIIENMGLSVATPDEAREILALKGADRTNI